MQAHVHWMFPLSSVAVDHWLPVMKMLLSVEKYQQQHPRESNENMKKLLILLTAVNYIKELSTSSLFLYFSRGQESLK